MSAMDDQVRRRLLNPSAPMPADYVHAGLEVRPAPGKGRGWFAHRPLASGELLIVAAPLATVDLGCVDDGDDPHDVLARTWLDTCPAETAALAMRDITGHASVNQQAAVHVAHANAFQVPGTDVVALFWKPSFCNHACAPLDFISPGPRGLTRCADTHRQSEHEPRVSEQPHARASRRARFGLGKRNHPAVLCHHRTAARAPTDT